MARALVLAALLLVVGATAGRAATIIIVNQDGAGEGFNDPTPAAPVGGNPGVTVGQQRLNVFQQAANIWGGLLPSAVTIRVQAQFNPQTCTPTTAVLGSAGPIEVFKELTGPQLPDTWYHIALANKLHGVDLNPALNDINATFNSNLNGSPGCLMGVGWYYGFDGNEGTNIELLPVILHEMGHGLGFSTLVNLSNGAHFMGFQDLYETFMRDNTSGLNWTQMTNGQRIASAINTGNVVWNGPVVTALSDDFLDGTPIMDVHIPVPPLPSIIPIGTATFGPSLTTTGVTADIVLVDDGTLTITDACEPIINGGQIAGRIALIDRGTCTFAFKAAAAQAEGAIAVIIANNVAGAVPITLGGTGPTITIPVVSVTLNDGNAIKAQLGGGVNVTLTIDPNDLAGADVNGRVQLYAPNPLELGSSISHYDTPCLPNLLMEPAINNNLSSDVDLTLALFDDLGWVDIITGIADAPHPRLTDLTVFANYPNPFNPGTAIRYAIPETQEVRLDIYDVQGRLVRSLVNRVELTGIREVMWEGNDNSGRPVSSGIYFVRLAGEGQVATRKIVLVK